MFLLTYLYADDMRTNMREDPFFQILMNLNDDESKVNSVYMIDELFHDLLSFEDFLRCV